MRWLALAIVLTLPSSALAQSSPAEQLEAIRELTFQAQFGDAITAARSLLDRDDLNASQRNAALEALAVAQIANRQPDDAQQTLILLYSRDPGHRLADPDASPPVLSAFARARESRPQQVPVEIAHVPPTLTQREAPQIDLQLTEGQDAVQEVRLIYRTGPEAEGHVVMNRAADGRYSGRIPVVGDASQATQLVYYVVALAPSQTPLGSFGSPREPVQITVPAGRAPSAAVAAAGGTSTGEEAPPPVLTGEGTPGGETDDGGGGSVVEEWWFWTLIGLVVVGGAVAVGVAVATSEQGPVEGTLGTARLMLLEL